MRRACLFSLAGRTVLCPLVCSILIVIANEPGLTARPGGQARSTAVAAALLLDRRLSP
jgi:hypothetical protein